MAGSDGSVKLLERPSKKYSYNPVTRSRRIFAIKSVAYTHTFPYYTGKTTTFPLPGDHMAEEFLTVAEAAHKLGVSREPSSAIAAGPA